MTIEQAKQTITNSTLPAKIKEQALGNLEQHWNELPSYLENTIAAAIDQFDWVKTRQGDDYWDSICKRAERGEFDPPAESVEEIETTAKQMFDECYAYAVKESNSHSKGVPFKDAENQIFNSANVHWLIRQLATLIHANRSLEKRIQSLENKKP